MKERGRRFRLDTAIVSTRPDGSQSVRITNMHDIRVLGEVLKPRAVEFAARLISAKADPQRNDGKRVSIPLNLLDAVAWLLLALPTARRGRPPKASTLQAKRLQAEGRSKRGSARAVSSKTGEPHENLRRRLRPKSKPKKRGGT
jgi:hypothetical protein